jgi:hypothetical protein
MLWTVGRASVARDFVSDHHSFQKKQVSQKVPSDVVGSPSFRTIKLGDVLCSKQGTALLPPYATFPAGVSDKNRRGLQATPCDTEAEKNRKSRRTPEKLVLLALRLSCLYSYR